MKASRNWKTVAGWVLHGLVAGIMLLAGSAKVLGLFPPEQVAKLGLGVPIQVIGAGELVSAVLLLVPRTASLGVLLTSGETDECATLLAQHLRDSETRLTAVMDQRIVRAAAR